MERQCRVCFDTDETSPFLTPCNCRGTQAYIHTHCLAVYCRYYPDGVCRVCLVQLKPVQSDESLYCLGLFAWILALGYAATLPSDPRAMYLTLVGGVILYYFSVRRLALRYAALGMLTTASFLIASFYTVVWILGGFAGLMTGIVLWMYVPSAFLCAGGLILASCFYSVVLVLFALTRTEPVIGAMLLSAIGGLWYLAIRARPPLRIL